MALFDARSPCAPARGDNHERRVLAHAEADEKMSPVKIECRTLPAVATSTRRPTEVDTVTDCQRSPGSNMSGACGALFYRLTQAARAPWNTDGFCIPEPVAEAGRMSEQVTQRDRPLAGRNWGFPAASNRRAPGRCRAPEHQAKACLARRAAARDRSDWLDHRGNAKHRIAGHDRPTLKPAPAETPRTRHLCQSQPTPPPPAMTVAIPKDESSWGKCPYAGLDWLFGGPSDRRVVRAQRAGHPELRHRR